MIDLLSQYEIKDIIIFLVMIALALQGATSFFDWAKERLLKIFKKEQQVEDLAQTSQTQIDSIVQTQEQMKKSLEDINSSIKLLISSDRDDIKAFITMQYHTFVEDKGWVDDFSLDCLEKRYSHYVDEGGNSFIAGMMTKLRDLPRHPIN